MLKATTANNNQTTNSNITNKRVETPKSTPKVEPTTKTETNQTSDIYLDGDQSDDNGPKGKLDDKVNQGNFEKIKNDMSLDEVSKIFGDKGMKISDMKINGRHTEMFMWSTGDFKKKIKVTFEKEKVVAKEKDGF